MNLRQRHRHDDGRVLDSIRLAIGAARDATELSALLDQICVGAARVTNAPTAFLALERGDTHDVVATVGRGGAPAAYQLLRALTLDDAINTGGAHHDDTLVVPLRTDIGNGVIVTKGSRRGSRASLALFVDSVAPLVDLHRLRDRAAVAAHQLLPPERVSGILASIKAGDALAIVVIDDLEELRQRQGQTAVDSVRAAAGVHLLNGTRPPGDLLATMDDRRFLLVLRDLKAPVEAVTHRLLQGWTATRPSTTLSVGAALHLNARPPLETLEDARRALASAQQAGGGQAHVMPAR